MGDTKYQQILTRENFELIDFIGYSQSPTWSVHQNLGLELPTRMCPLLHLQVTKQILFISGKTGVQWRCSDGVNSPSHNTNQNAVILISDH